MKRSGDGRVSSASVIHELEVYQEELATQNQQLLGMQRALEEAADRYADLYEFAPVALVTLDASGCTLEMNLTAAGLLEVNRQQCLRSPLVSLVAHGQRRKFLEHIRRCRKATADVVTELDLVTGRGRRFQAEITSRPSAAPGAGFRSIIMDLTDRLKAEEARRRADAERRELAMREQAARASAEAKDRFIAMLSHELRTPLTPILATVSELELRSSAPGELRDALSRIRRNVQVEARLIDDLLDVSRIEQKKLRLELQLVELTELIHEVLDDFREQIADKNIDLRLDRGAKRSSVKADRTRLQQVVSNFLRNALHFTPPGGRITVRAENPDERRLCVSVEDTGIGIQPERLQRVFMPFVQDVDPGRTKGGLGLGLSICRGIIEAHGGRVAAFSEGPGRGARFSFELAALSDHEVASLKRALEVPPPKPPPDVSGSAVRQLPTNMRVLIVEDHLDSAETLAEILERRGYRATVATSVHAALEEAESGFELLISDIGLPDGTGIELMEKLRARGPVRGIALSGFGSEKDVADSQRAGFSEHLTKPVDVRALLSAIQRACESSARLPS